MEKLIEYKGIIFGYTDEDTGKSIIATKDGVSKISYGNANFLSDERILKFIIFNNNLFAFITKNTANGYRILQLSQINTMQADTWTARYNTTSLVLDGVEYFEDLLYLFVRTWNGSSVDVYTWNASLTPILKLNTFDGAIKIYDTLYVKNLIYAVGLSAFGNELLLEYDGNSIVTVIDNFGPIAAGWPNGFTPIGKKLLVEYKGKVYYMNQSVATFEKLKSFNLDTRIITDEYTVGLVVTTMKLHSGMILLGTYHLSVNPTIDVKVFVVDEYEIETDLVSGEGAVHLSLSKVNSDPIFLIKDANESPMNPYTTFPVMATLKGKLNPLIKYCSRIEYYTDLNDVFEIIEMNIKDLIDQLCSLTDNFFSVDGENVANIKRRDMVGVSDAFMTIKNNSDYGQKLVKNVEFSNQNPINFRRIVVNWSNKKFGDSNPVAIGSAETSSFPTFEFDSAFVNNPILAKNIGMYMLNRLSASENLLVDLSFAYFLDGGENLIFDLNEDYVYLDNSKEWKLNKVIHNFVEKTTQLVLIERNIVNESVSI